MKTFKVRANLPKLFNWNDLSLSDRRLALIVLSMDRNYIWNQWDTLTPAIQLALHGMGAVNPLPVAVCS